MSSIFSTLKERIELDVKNFVHSLRDSKSSGISIVQETADKVSVAATDSGLHGPWLYTQGQDLPKNRWNVSMTLALTSDVPTPVVKCQGFEVEGELFFKKYDLTFLRYAFPVQMLLDEQKVVYSLNDQEYAFYVPGVLQDSKGMYFTCNGTQNKSDFKRKGHVEGMWNIFNQRQKSEDRCHYMLCGGDFLYNDGFEEYENDKKLKVNALGVFELPSIQQWLSTPAVERDVAPLTEKMEEELSKYYFNEYLKHLAQPELRQAMSTVPYMGIWDDHDIFDGYGSYTDSLNNSPVFKGMFKIALETYLLFQQQTTVDHAHKEGLFGPKGYHFLRYVDNGHIAILGSDNRTERTRERVASQETWDRTFQELESLPANCKHLIVMLGIPIVYTNMKKFVEGMENSIVEECFTKFKALRNQFGMIELEDDGIDHWDCKEHESERRELIEKFQKFAEKGIRVTFLSGDVHLGGLGIILPKKTKNIRYSRDLEKIAPLPTAMVQVISSAIENNPPSRAAARAFGDLGEIPEDVNETTVSKLLKVSHTNKPLNTKCLIPKRNYGILQGLGSHLNVKLYVESKKVEPRFFEWCIPATSSVSSYLPKVKKLNTSIKP